MRFLDVEIANFLSFGPKQTVGLTDLGLAALVGRNRDSGRADSNGAGKSTLPEAIYWCLFGDTLRGLKGDEVIHIKSGRDCKVSVQIEDAGHTYRITRTRGMKGFKRPNDLTVQVDGADAIDSSGGINADTQVMVDTIVGMDRRTFAQVVLLSYGARPISELTDAEQKRVLDDIMQNDVLVRAEEITVARLRDGQNELAGIEGEVREAALRAEVVAQRLTKHEADAATRDVQVRAERFRIMQRKVALEGEIEALCATGLGTAMAMESDAAKGAVDAQKSIDANSVKIAALRAAAQGPRGSMLELKGKLLGAISVRSASSNAVEKLAGQVCPTCRRFVDPGDADHAIADWDAQVKQDQAHLIEVEQAIVDLDKELSDKQFAVEVERDEARQQLLVAMDAHRKARERVRDLSSALQRVSMLEQQLLAVEEELRRVGDDADVYDKLVLDARLELAVAEKRLSRLQQKRKLIDMRVRYLLFWRHGFGNRGLKSYLLDGVIPFLNERAQRYADIMSGGDLKIWFTAQRDLKKGTTREEFQIHVVNRHGSDVYRGNSDGEKRRSNYAVSWAFADLAAQRAGKPVRLKFLDETFENLDEAGEEGVVKLLHDTLATHESIVCITHSDRLQNHFSKVITVIKEDGHSRVEV